MAKDISLKQLRYRWPVYFFMLPSLLLICLFSYFPATNGIFHAFFRWNGSTVETFIGLDNFRDLLGWSPTLWIAFASWVALMMMTVTGKPAWASERAQWALCGLVLVLGFLVMGATASESGTIMNLPAQDAAKWISISVFCTLGGIILHYLFNSGLTKVLRSMLVIFGFCWFFDLAMQETGDTVLWSGFSVIFILVLANIIKLIPSIVTAVVVHRLKNEKWQYLYRVLFVVPMIIPGMVYLLVWKFFYDPNQGVLNILLTESGLMDVLMWIDGKFGWDIFISGKPSWLGDARLVIPSLIFWGFPWVGVVGVLLYLAGLSSISQDVYEAGDLDGVNWFQKFLYIELPLILTQVRINMILLIIGTLQTYGQILIILGASGGPKGVAMVPGLYMFSNAFVEGYAGKACAIGLILFVFILVLTEINNRYVRVEK